MFKKLYKDWFIKEHRKMWGWISRETMIRKEKVLKEDYIKILPLWKRLITKLHHDCFMCAYTKGECGYCPLIWCEDDEDGGLCIYVNSIFSLWFDEKDWNKAAFYAQEIADLPEKKSNI